MSIPYPALACIVFFAYMLGATTGFGSSLIALTLAVHVLPMDFLVPVVIPLNLSVCAILVARHHDHVDRRALFRKILPLAGLGVPAGLFLYHLMETSRLQWGFGVFVSCLSLFELYRTLRGEENATRPPPAGVSWSDVWLLGGGITQGLWVSGGPMVAYWAGKNILDKGAFRSTLCAVFLALNALLLVSHGLSGAINRQTLGVSACLLPFLVGGLAAGEWAHARIAERSFRVLVYATLVLAGISIVFRSTP